MINFLLITLSYGIFIKGMIFLFNLIFGKNVRKFNIFNKSKEDISILDKKYSKYLSLIIYQ